MTSTTWVRSKRLTLALAMGISAIGLVGCGDSSNGSDAGGTASAQINFKVNNTSGYDIQSVQIVDKKDKELAKDKFTCEKDATCNFQAAMNQAGALKFYNKQGELVGAYMLAQAPNSVQVVKLSAYMQGLYIFSELQTLYPETPASLLEKMNKLFANYQNSDETGYKYQELGQYYRLRVIGTGLSNEDFIKDLHLKLEEGKALPAGLLKLKSQSAQFSERMALQATLSVQKGSAGGGCPSALSGLASIAKGARTIPGVGLLGGIVEAGCKMAAPEDKRLDEIQSKLDEMAETLNQNDISLAKLLTYTASEGANTVLKDTEKKVTDANDNVVYYMNIIDGYGSFMAFVDAHKSFKNAWGGKKNKDMENFFGTFTKDWSRLILVGNTTDKASLTRAFDILCDSHDSANVNIVKNRKDCNGYILNYQKMVIGTYLTHLTMLKDVTDTLNKYSAKEGEFIREKVTMPIPLKTTWSETYSDVMLPKMQAALSSAAENFAPTDIAVVDSNGAFFDVYAGLPVELLDQFQTTGLKSTCSQGSNIGRQKKPEPNITNWVKNGKNSYITVNCKEAINSSNRFASNYYLEDGNDVVNLMGVLVGKNSPNTKTSKTHGDNNGLVGGDENATIYFPANNNWAIFSTDKSIKDYSGVISPGVEPNARIVYKGTAFKKIENGEFNKYFTNYSGYSSNGGSISKLYVRYTDPSSGISYVFAQYFWRGVASLRYSHGCLGKGCNVDSFTKLSFENGPTLYNAYFSTDGTNVLPSLWLPEK